MKYKQLAQLKKAAADLDGMIQVGKIEDARAAIFLFAEGIQQEMIKAVGDEKTEYEYLSDILPNAKAVGVLLLKPSNEVKNVSEQL